MSMTQCVPQCKASPGLLDAGLSAMIGAAAHERTVSSMAQGNGSGPWIC